MLYLGVFHFQFDRYSDNGQTISEKDLGIILLSYAGLSERKTNRMLKRVKKFMAGDQVCGLERLPFCCYQFFLLSMVFCGSNY